jgi:hypothetical protein
VHTLISYCRPAHNLQVIDRGGCSIDVGIASPRIKFALCQVGCNNKGAVTFESTEVARNRARFNQLLQVRLIVCDRSWLYVLTQ